MCEGIMKRALSNPEAKYVRLRAHASRALGAYLRSGSHVDFTWLEAARKQMAQAAIDLAEAAVGPMWPRPLKRKRAS